MTGQESTHSTFAQGEPAVRDAPTTPAEPRPSVVHRHPVGVAIASGLAGLVVGAFGAAGLVGLWAPPPPPPGWGPPPPPPGAWGPSPPTRPLPPPLP
ncbi:hypothetical protein [Mycobacterium bohemicum]|uniref:hypothetical protein n=1 Tax=Mycobacterium bohemicum TaxID=56425 RepID=UPI0021F372C3|nr:hypothetical protein [Mycobacterium bohemicum]MCV6969479.1 hypothetical protein [Mycobacterium bohemicum]